MVRNRDCASRMRRDDCPTGRTPRCALAHSSPRRNRPRCCGLCPAAPKPSRRFAGGSPRRLLTQLSRRKRKMATSFRINGRAVTSDALPDTPLLWVIREQLKLTGTKFGCGAGLCGACMVHIDGGRAFSCQTQLSDVADKTVTTIEGLAANASHPV